MAFSGFKDWLFSERDFGKKIVGGVLVYFAAVLTPFKIIEHRNNAELERTFDVLDQRPTVIFESVADGGAQGYPQEFIEAAHQAALEVEGIPGNGLAYGVFSEGSCAKKHGRYETTVSPSLSFDPIVRHSPFIVAWQTATDDPSVAVPLYSTPDERIAVRRDGATFDLALNQVITPP